MICSATFYHPKKYGGIINRTIGATTFHKKVSRYSAKHLWFNAEFRRLRLQYRRAKKHRRLANNAENFKFQTEASKAHENASIRISVTTMKTIKVARS